MADNGRIVPDVHLNLNVRGLSPSSTLAINERSDALRRRGRRIYKLGLGQSPFPVPDPVVEALRQNAHQKDYLPVKGLMPLREAVADYNRRSRDVPTAPDDVMIGPGSKELLFLLQLVYYGDLVVPTPAWVSYAPQAHIIGRHVRFIETRSQDDWLLTPERLDALCSPDPKRPRIVILNYPSNPTGSTYTADALEQLARVARRHRVILLSDEIYGELHHRGQHVSIARFYPEGTIISAGLSKWCGAGGWRLGTFSFPSPLRWLLDAMAVVASETYTATSAPIQYAAERAFNGGPEIEDYLSRSRRVLRALGGSIARRLHAADVRVGRPQGGFYLFPDFRPWADVLRTRGIETSAQLCEVLLDATGVALLPGSDFGRPPTELTVRLAYVDFDGTKALDAAGQLSPDSLPAADVDEAFAVQHCPAPLEAIDRVIDWIEAR